MDTDIETSASLPNNMRTVGPYSVNITPTGDLMIQHHYAPSHIWIDSRDIDGIILAIQELSN